MPKISVADLLDKPLFAKVSTRVNLRSLPSTDSKVVTQVPNGETVGVVRAWVQRVDGIWFQVQGVANAWVRQDVVTNVPVKQVGNITNQTGVNLMDKLVANDFKLYHQMLVIADQITKLEKKGVDTDSFSKTFESINAEYSARQAKIKNSKLVNFQVKLAAGFEELKNQFSTTKAIESISPLFPRIFGIAGNQRSKSRYSSARAAWKDIGEKTGLSASDVKSNHTATHWRWEIKGIQGISGLPLVPVAIGAVVGLATGVTLYFVFKPDFDASERNLVESRALKKLLDNASPQVAAQVRQDLENQIDAANKAGLQKGAFSTLFGVGKFLIPVVLTLAAIRFLPDLLKPKKT